MDRFQPPGMEAEAKLIAKCACGCGEEIYEGYEHINYDDDWFYEDWCLLKYLGAAWRTAG